MQQNTKSLIINIATAALVIGVVAVGYIVLTKNKDVAVEIITPSESIDDTIMVGIEINKTFEDLGELKVAVGDARKMIGSPVFKTLKDFSVVVPAEKIGRGNPFTSPSWRTSK